MMSQSKVVVACSRDFSSVGRSARISYCCRKSAIRAPGFWDVAMIGSVHLVRTLVRFDS